MLYFGGENDRYRITAYYYYANTVPDSYAFTGTSLLWESIGCEDWNQLSSNITASTDIKRLWNSDGTKD